MRTGILTSRSTLAGSHHGSTNLLLSTTKLSITLYSLVTEVRHVETRTLGKGHELMLCLGANWFILLTSTQ